MKGLVELGNELEVNQNDDNKELDNELSFSFFDDSTNDFRLNVEGRSGTGKTNTLAVIIEELADYNIPTLVLDRLGVLTTAAIEVENMVVVGAKQEPGIDIAVPLQEVEIIVDMLLDQGMKVMLDLQTYKGLGDEEEQTLHKAVADVLDELMDRSHQMMRAGNRRRSLVIADEVHHLAPETGTSHVDPLDRHVKRCRSKLMNLATEGGNKGVSSIYSYQRRALTKNTVVSQSDNYVTHKLEAGDKDRASKETGIPADIIDSLNVGEVVVKGQINDNYDLQTVKVRRRDSPDPREEEFEVPEPPEELGEALEQIQEQVEVKEEERKEQQNKVEELKEKLESKEEKLENLREQANIAEEIRRAVNRDSSEDVDENVIQELEQLQEDKKDLKQELEKAHEELAKMKSKKEDLEYKVEDLNAQLEEYKGTERAKEDVVDSARSILRQFGELDTDVEDARQEVQDLKDEVSELRDENRRLREREPDVDVDDKLDNYEDVLENEYVSQVIEEAKNEGSERYISGILAAIINRGGPVSYQKVADNLGVKATSNISRAATTLESYKVIEKLEKDGRQHVDLNTGDDGIREIKKQAKEREKTKELMDKV